MSTNIYVYLLIMALVCYAIRVIPFLVLREPIENEFVQSFLHYVPYVTLSVMTFPAITAATQYSAAGYAAMIAGIIAAWRGRSLLSVALICCVTALAMELVLTHGSAII